MTIQDANKLLAIEKANYSYAFKSMTKQEKIMLVHSWAFALQDIPADIVLIAFMQLLTTSKWLPTVAEIRERVAALHYEAAYSAAASMAALTGRKEPQKIIAARDYIERMTAELRGDGPPGLSLDAILEGPYMPVLGSGEMDLQAIEGQYECPAALEGDEEARTLT